MDSMLQQPPFNMDLRRSTIVGVLFVSNIAIGWYGLKLVNIPMFLCIRRTATFFTLLA